MMREMNAQRAIVTMKDGTVFRGSINIGSCRRLSDFFRKMDSGQFVVMFEATAGQSTEKKVYFLNWNHILWVEPNELSGEQRIPAGISSQSL